MTFGRDRSSRLALVHAAWGGTLLVAPSAIDALAPASVAPSVRVFARVLGARHLLYALLIGRRPSKRDLMLGAVVDAIHGATMLGLAAAGVGPRRLTLANAATATVFAATERSMGRR